MTEERKVIARLGTLAKAYPQVLFHDGRWCLRVGPKFTDWRSYETADELVLGLLQETIEPELRRQQLLDRLLSTERELRFVLDQVTCYRKSMDGSMTPPATPVPPQDVV